MAKKEESRILQIVVLEQECHFIFKQTEWMVELQCDAGERSDRDDGVNERRETNCLRLCVFRSVLLSF